MCILLEVSRSCYYRWLHVDHQDDKKLNELIEYFFLGSRQIYGARRNKRRFRVLTTNSNHNYAIAPNRVQQDKVGYI